MNRLLKIFIITVLSITLVLPVSIPVIADTDDFTILTSPFNVDQSSAEYNVLQGSTIIHLDKGITEVYNPDNSLAFKVRDSDAQFVPTAYGLKSATHVVMVPSGAHITGNEDYTETYYKGDLILTVINARKNESTTRDIDWAWLEQTRDLSVANLDLFSAYWTVPSSPPDPDDDAVDFLFNGIQDQYDSMIIQPVLEWNQCQSGQWTCRAWYGCGTFYGTDPIDASVGDSIFGIMYYVGGGTGWIIQIQNDTTEELAYITTTCLGTSNLHIFCVLEGYNIGSDDDVPGDTTFDNMYIEYNNNTVDITWYPIDDIPSGSGLTYLYAQVYSDTKVKLHTAN